MIWPIIKKSIKEQVRNYWILLLTVALAPFFVFIYYLINEASQPSYDVLILNQDQGFVSQGQVVNRGAEFPLYINSMVDETSRAPLKLKLSKDKTLALKQLKKKSVDALLIIPPNFSSVLNDSFGQTLEIEIIGDVSSIPYMISAVWVGELLNDFISLSTGQAQRYTIKETALGLSGTISEFELWMPGILILAIIMLMFSATIAIITEVDQKTILRLKLSKMKAWQFLIGIGSTQILVGMISILLTLSAAVALGFEMRGSYLVFLLITILTSISMVAFSLILAAVTRSVTDVLIIGNFPMFLFMFFTGAAFPMKGKALFHVDGYGISWQSLMSPTHAINALNKISVLGLGIKDILPELSVLIVITAIYFILGVWAFQKRHL